VNASTAQVHVPGVRPGLASVWESTLNTTTRLAGSEDAAAIVRIYNQGIEERTATFETEPRDALQIAAALAEKGDRYPTVVAERDGTVIAFAAASPYSARACYAGIIEFSVYADRAVRGTGAGSVAMERLIAEAARVGHWKLVSRIFPENVASLALCRRLGFREVGVYRRHAKLDGTWRDCVIVERLLGAAAE
jgi:L-amino acid N-acyltransferase YncA